MIGTGGSIALISRGARFEVYVDPAGGRLSLALVFTAEILGPVEVFGRTGESQEGYLSDFHAGIEGDGEVGDVAEL